MPGFVPLDTSRLTRRRLSYVLACLLPFASAYITSHSEAFLLIPFVLFFFTVVLCATLGGILPALLSLLFCVIGRIVFPFPGDPLFPMNSQEYLRYGFLLVCGSLVSAIGSNLDRSRRKLEAAMADLQDRNDALVASLTVSRCASWTWDANSKRGAVWFPGSYPVFGRPFADVESLNSVASLLEPDDVPRLAAIRETMRTTTEPFIFEFRVLWPDGETHYLEMRANRIAGTAPRWRGVTIDITERKRTEAALLRGEKLAAMGRLASTVAHEINNPLESVTNLLYLVSTADLKEPTLGYVTMAERELARLSNITRLTLGFVRSSATLTHVDLDEAIEDVLSIFHHRLESNNVAVTRHYQTGVLIHIAPHELRQVITNLIANAADATAGKPDASITVTTRSEDGKAIFLIEDNGCGIIPQNMPRIFEAFFTTKAEVGTGIGLWVTREIVERHRGTITVESSPTLAPGIITRFRIELPLAPTP